MIYQLKIVGNHPWSKVVKYKGSHDFIGTYFTRSGNRHTGLTPEDARRLEKELQYPEGHLSPLSRFWITYAIKVGATGTIINTDTAIGELQYLFLKSHYRVADGLQNLKPGNDWILLNQESEAKEKNRLNKIRRDAAKEFDKMSLDDMRKCLRVYGYRSDTMSNELIESKLYDLIEKDPKDFFVKWVNNKSKDTEFLLETAISKNIVRRTKTTYYYGTDVIGITKEDAIAYLDDKKNSDIKLAIMSATESKV